ncbi:MAG: HDIG domain-containing protein [Thaumarchaeota archaeon]|nr:HDIG domain-containing protein [Nitrososphaerota archaeon]
MIPSDAQALELHRKYGSKDVIVEHCKTVTKVANVLAGEFQTKGVAVDAKAITAGALLHDIGRSRTQTVRHGVEGSEIIEHEGVDRKVVEIVRKHVGAGISPEEAKLLGLPELDYVPRTLEERIVCFADKMVDSSTVRQFEAEVQRFTVKKHDVVRLLALKRGLQEELGEDPEPLIFDKIKESR